MAHAMEAVGQDVEEEAPDELVGREANDLVALASPTAVVLPSERDVILIQGEETAVGDGDTMGVAAEIGEHLLGPAEG